MGKPGGQAGSGGRASTPDSGVLSSSSMLGMETTFKKKRRKNKNGKHLRSHLDNFLANLPSASLCHIPKRQQEAPGSHSPSRPSQPRRKRMWLGHEYHYFLGATQVDLSGFPLSEGFVLLFEDPHNQWLTSGHNQVLFFAYFYRVKKNGHLIIEDNSLHTDF